MNPKEANVRSSPLLICTASAWVLPILAELWEHRELLYFYTWRDIKMRYKQIVLGVGWAVLQPLSLMLIFTVMFDVFRTARRNIAQYVASSPFATSCNINDLPHLSPSYSA